MAHERPATHNPYLVHLRTFLHLTVFLSFLTELNILK